MQLPMWNFKTQVLQAIEDNQVVIICGETGWYVTDHIVAGSILNVSQWQEYTSALIPA